MGVCEQVSCYRMELSQMLQQFVESYSSILLQQFDSFYMSENLQERELGHLIQQQQVVNDELMSKRVEYDRLIEQAKVIVHSKETIISSLQRNQDMIERENMELKEQVHQLQVIIN